MGADERTRTVDVQVRSSADELANTPHSESRGFTLQADPSIRGPPMKIIVGTPSAVDLVDPDRLPANDSLAAGLKDSSRHKNYGSMTLMRTAFARCVFGLLFILLVGRSGGADDLGFVRIEARIEQGRAIVAFNGAQIGRGLILTCAHCCQSAGGRGAAVSVHILAAGSWKPYRTVRGTVLCYDPAADCGLIRLEDPDALATAYVLAPRQTVMRPGDAVHAFHWDSSTEALNPVRGQIMRMNPYLGSPVIETSTAPRPGDSGGPLILAERRQIVGVTSALNLELQRGIYCGLDPIWQLIDGCGQTALAAP